MKKIKIGAVSYLNTKPLLYGIKQNNELFNQIEIIEDYPARISQMLAADEIDVGLVPVATLLSKKSYSIISDYCIGATGDVASVGLFSEKTLEEIKTVLLDYQSETSVALCKILIKEVWKISPEIKNAKPGFVSQIKDETAAVIIGDSALEQRDKSKYFYDLAGEWKKFTDLPFVFATWVANKKLDDDFVALFNEANKSGIENIDEILKHLHFSYYDLKTYFTKNISYNFDEEKKMGMNLFLKMMTEERLPEEIISV